MDAGGGGMRRPSRDTSPDQARAGYIHRPRPTPTTVVTRKAHIVYYLSRNGQLEHPHFMELHHLPNLHLRLKDVTDRLNLLRGKGMPSLFSWSCKRSYKNGYVWNDLSENDVIYPADGAEYVLKGSEIIQGLSERFQQIQLSDRRRRAPPTALRSCSRQLLLKGEEEDEEDFEEEEYGGKGSNTPLSRCSRGIATDETELAKTRAHHHPPMEIRLDDHDASPPSSSSSEKANVSAAAAAAVEVDSDADPGGTRSSVLMQLIACGSAAVKGKGGACSSAASSASGGGGGSSRRRSGGLLHKGVVSKAATQAAGEVVSYRQMEDKEYYSGSIVESRRLDPQPGPTLKKSSSYNEERSSKLGIGEVGSTDQAMQAEEKAVEGKCIPGRKRGSSCNKQQQQLAKK